jgi:hypothetical protein
MCAYEMLAEPALVTIFCPQNFHVLPPAPPPHSHTQIQIHTHTHTHSHTHTHINTHSHAHTHILTHTPTRTHALSQVTGDGTALQYRSLKDAQVSPLARGLFKIDVATIDSRERERERERERDRETERGGGRERA